MRNKQELTKLVEPETREFKDGQYKTDFNLPLPGVSLLLICRKSDKKPARVTGLQAKKYEGILKEKEEIYLSWNPINSKYIKTYEILYAKKPGDKFIRINQADLIDHSFIHLRESQNKQACYKVIAVDYWGRKGKASEIIKV
ncbi:MAG: hypothetical protein ACOC4G_14285 [Bacillota bacterium]